MQYFRFSEFKLAYRKKYWQIRVNYMVTKYDFFVP
eukprot:UN13631